MLRLVPQFSRSFPTASQCLVISRYFLPMPLYSFTIFPMQTMIILLVHSTLIVIFLSLLMFPFYSPSCSHSGHLKEQAQDEYDWHGGLMVHLTTTSTPYKGLSRPGPMARDRSSSPSPRAKRINDVVLNHQFTPSCTSSKLVELLVSGIILFLNHSLHTPSGS